MNYDEWKTATPEDYEIENEDLEDLEEFECTECLNGNYEDCINECELNK